VNVAGAATTANFGYGAANVYIGNNKTSGTILIGNSVGGGTVTTSLQGNTINLGTDTDTTSITLGDGTTGKVRATYLDGNSSGLNLGTNTTATSGAVTLGNTSYALSLQGAGVSLGTLAGGNVSIGNASYITSVNSPLYLSSSTLDRASSGALNIGATNVSVLSLGRSGQEQRSKGSSVVEEALYVDNGTGATSVNTRISYPVYGCIGNSFLGTAQSISTSTNRFLAGSSWQSRNLTQAISPVGSEGFTDVPHGIYEYKLMGRLVVTAITGSPTQVTVGFEGVNLDFPGIFTGITYPTTPDGGGTFAANDVIPLAFSGVIGIGTSVATGAMRVTLACDTGTVSVNLYYTFSIVRAAPAA
jgi:hypothetical protein